jgi:acetyltransferase
MNTLFYPESIVVVGVSEEVRNLGRNIVENLDRFGFAKPVYLVGRDGGRLRERTIHRRIEDLEETPDLAVFLIPAKHIPEALEACGRKGIRYAVIESAGFNEFGGEGDELSRKLLDAARKWGIRFVGPNCISIINLENGMTLPFVLVDPAQTRKGSVSVAAQSGGVVVDTLRLLALEHLGFNKLVSMGNKMDLKETDFLRFFLSDRGTSVTGLYLENISAGRELMNLAAESEKPVIVLKANTNPGSNRIARFHTAALAGDDAVADAAFRQAGIHRVQNMRQFVDAFKVFSLPPIRGNRLGVICRSGGQGVMLADATHRNGFTLASFSDAFYDVVQRGIRAGVIRMTNPLDLGDVFDLDRHIAVMEEALKEKEVDGVVFCHAYVARREIPATERLIRAARELSLRYDKPVVLVMLADKKDWFPLREVENFPVFSEADDALRALRLVLDHHGNRNRRNGRKEGPLPFPSPAAVPPGGPGRLLPPRETFDLLEKEGLPVAPFGTAATEEEALAAAERVGWPVALKVSHPFILHKTEADGVRLDLRNEEELALAFRSMKGDEFLVQKMMPPGREVIIGGKRDPEFGPVVLFGLGGIFVEVFRDAALRVAPLDEEEAERMIAETRGAVLLDGFRGMPPADRKALVRSLVAVSRLLMNHPEIVNLDINPLIVGPDGEGVAVVDGKIEM